MRFLRSIAWDGCLPLAVSLIPAVLRMPGVNGVTICVLMVFGIVIAALVRAQVAHNRIHEICSGRPTFLRQHALAIAILLLFEMLSGILQFERPAHPAPYLMVVEIDVSSVLTILWALRPFSLAG